MEGEDDMRELIFSSILIADIAKKTAWYQEFSKGFNVITSSDNHVGKSSLLKSLYYALGAEVEFDNVWEKNSKLYIVVFSIDEKKYKIVRFAKEFVLFENEKMLLSTNKVTKELSKKFEEIFDFGVYLPNKQDEKIELAPPVFMFLPYYIDQDRGWAEIYDSFSNLEQYKKDARIKSLYYHLGIFNKNTIELIAEKDSLNSELSNLSKENERLRIILSALSKEIENIVPAENVEDLDKNLILSKEKISALVKEIGAKRNEIQQIETSLQNHKSQLDAITIAKQHAADSSKKSFLPNTFLCPNCGYKMDKELFEIVQKNFVSFNKQYAEQQIELLIQRIETKLGKLKTEYVELTNRLKEEETVCNVSKDTFDTYLAQKGLAATYKSLSDDYKKNLSEQFTTNEKLKDVSAKLRKLSNKKEVEEKYIEFAKKNLISLGAWEELYVKQLKLLKPLKGQGTLTNKIILAQIIALFQTMDSMHIESNKFPFVIDSPRGNEASLISSEEILKLIFKINCIPQIILATIDFQNFEKLIDSNQKINVVVLEQQYKLLNERVYSENKDEIEALYELFCNSKEETF